MNPSFQRCIDSRATSAIVIALFCAASALSIYSGDSLAMTVGSRSITFVERASHVLMLAFQLWLYPLYWFRERFPVFMLHDSIPSSLITAALSAALLFALFQLIARRFARIARGIIVLLIFCTVVETYSFTTDMQQLRALDESYIGP